MWVFCINVYNDRDFLAQCLRAIRNQPSEKRIVVIDGAYKLFPHFKCPSCGGKVLPTDKANKWDNSGGRENCCLSCGVSYEGEDLEKFCSPKSDDGTLDVAREMADVIVEADGHWESEWQKRNEYLQYAEDGDMVCVVDADEILYGNLPPVESLKYDDYVLSLRNMEHPDSKYPIYRVFRMKGYVRYEGFHYALWRDGELMTKKKKSMPYIKGVSLLHYSVNRPADRNHMKGVYYRSGLGEREYRREHGI